MAFTLSDQKYGALRTVVVCVLSLTAIVAGLSGCALTPGHVNIAYTPLDSGGAVKVAGAEALPVRISVSDQRASRDAVGHKTNGYGMEMAPITSDNDVPQTLQSAIESELRNRGFNVGGTGPTVAVTLTKFENRFVNGFWSGTATAEVVMNVVVERNDNTILYSKLIDEQGVNPEIQLASAENAGIALNRALQAAVTKLFEDQAFLSSLEAAGKNAKVQTASAPEASASAAISGKSKPAIPLGRPAAVEADWVVLDHK